MSRTLVTKGTKKVTETLVHGITGRRFPNGGLLRYRK